MVSPVSWAERAADRSPLVQRSRSRSLQQAKVIVDAARRLIGENGDSFTTQELVKEAGVALQTFYRYFAGKDQLLLAVIEDMVSEAAATYAESASEIPDPVARLRVYVMMAVRSLDADGRGAVGARFITTEHWRLHRLFPDELAQATKPFTDLVRREVQAAAEAGLLKPSDIDHDAWFVTALVMAVYHHYAFAASKEPAEVIGNHLWAFCLSALGGTPAADAKPRRGSTRRAR